MSSRVKFAVRVHQGGYDYNTLQRIWQDADRLGYHAASLYDLLSISTLECWTTLTALAAQTSRLRLIPMVLANTYRHPALLAKMASTLDVISNGRLELGIGAGGSQGDHLASGLPFPSTRQRVEMLEEAVAIIKAMWTQPEVDFQGRYYSLRGPGNQPPPAQRPHPPILIGGHGERYLLGAVARHADICNIGSELTLEEHRRRLGVMGEHCRREGRDLAEIEVTHNTRVFIGETQEDVGRAITGAAVRAGRGVDEFRNSLGNAVVGTPEECTETLRRYVEEGIGYFFLIFPDPAPSEALDLFARQVMPHFAGAGEQVQGEDG